MPSRRTFLKAGVAVSTSNLLLNSMANAAAKTNQNKRISENYAIVIDQTLPQARQFSDAISELHIQTYQINKGISGLWMNTLEPRLKESAFALAGLTRGAPLFYLEYLSKEYGMRLYYRIEHQTNAKSGFEHKVEGHINHSGIGKDMQSVGANWPTLAANVVRDEIIEVQSLQGGDIPLLDLSEKAQDTQETVYSWMLVPSTNI